MQLLWFVSGCGQTVIDIKEARLIKVDLEGFDGNGTAVVSVNESKLKALKKEYRDKDNYSDIKEILDKLAFDTKHHLNYRKENKYLV